MTSLSPLGAALTKPILLLDEAYNDTEATANFPFLGPAGVALLQMLGEAGVITLSPRDINCITRYYSVQDHTAIQAVWMNHRAEIRATNVFNLKLPRNQIEELCGPKTSAIPGYPAISKSKYIRAEFEPELERLTNEILTLDPNLIICLGNTPLWALAGRGAITKIRGTTFESTHTVAGFKLLCTYHPTAITRQWELRPTCVADLMKSNRENAYAEIRRPHREIWIEPTLDDIRRFMADHVRGCDLLSVDIETSGSRITCIGFAPRADLAIVIPFDDARAKNGNYWPSREAESAVWGVIRRVLGDGSIPKLFQNGAFDIAFLWRAYGIKTYNAQEDTMLMSHALQPESLKGLGYLGSIYSDEGSWKHMRAKHETIKRDN